MNDELKAKNVLFNSKRWVQFGFIKLGLKAMKNKDLYDLEVLVLNEIKQKESEKILKLVYKEMDKRHLKHLNVKYMELKNVKKEN